ncbi:hypothetical protein ES708_10541 [subsurface metagenome]
MTRKHLYKLKRPLGKQRYKKLFVIATEGSKTEPQYFNLFISQNAVIHIECLKCKNDSSPNKVLSRIKKYLKEYRLKRKRGFKFQVQYFG